MGARAPGRVVALRLRAVQTLDRLRLRRLAAQLPGLHIDPGASTNLALARYTLPHDATLRIAAGVVTERRPQALHFYLEPGARVEIGAGTWLRTDFEPLTIAAFAGARLEVGPDCFLNGCHVSAKQLLQLGRGVLVGPNSRIYDADQHDLDAEHPEVREPVRIRDHVWVASDVTVLRGVEIGAHSVIGTRSLVTRSVPPHTLAYGIPAEPRGSIGDRTPRPGGGC